MDAALQTRILACPTLPTLPAVAVEVVELCQRDEIEIARVVRLLERDPALAAKVLRVANSVAVAARSKVTTLTRALTLLGTNSVLTLALSFSLVTSRRRGARHGFDHEAYWRRALLAALAGRLLAEERHLDREELFLAALLQDLGMLVLAEVLGADYGALVAGAPDHATLARVERERLGADHAEVSAFLATRWNLPALVVETARGSHDPGVAGARPELGPAVGAVHLAGLLAGVFAGEPLDGARAAAARDGMSEAALAALIDRMGAEIPATASDFDLSLGDPAALDAVLERAKEALVLVSVRAEQAARDAAEQANTLAAANRHLAERSRRDALTGLLNRRELDGVLDRAFRAAQGARSGPLSLLFCDIDKFKGVNDRHGHAAGDRVLAGVAAALSGALRSGDAAGRYGGEEFVAVLPAAGPADAAAVAERIRREVEAARHDAAGAEPLRVTVSLGQATLRGGESLAALLAAADACLYEAKRAGRNRVVARP
jgi:diguanylate cyclase (GGDEF)-like protein